MTPSHTNKGKMKPIDVKGKYPLQDVHRQKPSERIVEIYDKNFKEPNKLKSKLNLMELENMKPYGYCYVIDAIMKYLDEQWKMDNKSENCL